MNLIAPNEEIAETRSWRTWFSQAGRILNGITQSGATTSRPTKGLYVGRRYFDTTLGYPVWYDGSGWVDATGASA